MPQESRFRRGSRSRSRSRGKKSRRRRSSDSSYSRSRSRSRDKRFHGKERSRRSPPRHRRSSAHSPRDRKRHTYDNQPRSRSTSPAPRHQRPPQKVESFSGYALDTSKVLGGNFSEIPGLNFIGHSGGDASKDRSFSPQRRSSQDLDMRLRELSSQQSSGGSRPRQPSGQPKNEPRDYYGPKEPSPERFQQRNASPIESMRYPKEQGMAESSRYHKDQGMPEPSRYPKDQATSDNGRFREQQQQQRPDYGLRVEVKRKHLSPKQRKLDPSLVVIPRRKDEGLRPLFDRPEIIIRVLEDDPELYPEKYERFACWRKSPEPQHGKDNRDFDQEEDIRVRPRKHSRGHRDRGRSPSPELPSREATVMMKPFTIFEKYEQSLRSRPAILQELEDSQLSMTSSRDLDQSQPSLPTSAHSLAIDSLHRDSSDLRHDLEVRRHRLSDVRSPIRGMASDQSHDHRGSVSDRRPVRERLGQVDGGDVKSEGPLPDFRKEVEEIAKQDPLAEFKGNYFMHDDRDEKSPPGGSRRGERRPERGHYSNRTPFRGSYRGLYNNRGRGRGYLGKNFIPGFRGGYRGGFNRPWNRGRGASIRGGQSSSWSHDKFHDKYDEKKTKTREEKVKKKDKSEKKEKKSKSSDKKKSKKSKKSPDRSKAKKESRKSQE